MHQIAEHNAKECVLFCLFLPESFWTRQDERTDGAQVVVNDLPQILRFLCVVQCRLRETARLWEKVGSWYAHTDECDAPSD